MHVGIIGGTGPAGRGLAVRAAAAGHQVTIGSRDTQRGVEVVTELLGDRELAISGSDNEGAATAELIVLATPWESAIATVKPLREALQGKVVVSMVNALVREGKEMLPLFVPRGSMAATVQAALPDSLIGAAFHHLPAAQMLDLESGLTADVLVCSDHATATAAMVELIGGIGGLRPIDAGSLAQAAAIEAFTAVCISVNIRHKVHSTLVLGGFH